MPTCIDILTTVYVVAVAVAAAISAWLLGFYVSRWWAKKYPDLRNKLIDVEQTLQWIMSDADIAEREIREKLQDLNDQVEQIKREIKK